MSNIKLKPGDILLFEVVPNSPWHDKLIAIGERLLGKQWTQASYCHAALIDEDTNLMLEAVWPKTHIIPLKSRNNKIQVFRVKKATKAQCYLAIEQARKDLGLWYNVGKLFFGLFPHRHQVICSTYVSKAWKAAGVKLEPRNVKVFSPDELACSKLLRHIGELKLKK